MKGDQEENISNINIKENSSWLQKAETLKKIITVEPLTVFYQIGISLSKPALYNLEIEKACRVDLNYNDTVCDAVIVGNHTDYRIENNAVQILITRMNSWQQPIQCFVPLILCLMLGSFSDRYKLRKPFFLLPVLGESVGKVGGLLCVMYMKLWPLNILGISQNVLPSFFGGKPMIMMATTAYIADMSSVKMRTLRLGILHLSISVGTPFANFLSGILFEHTGYMGTLYISVLFLLIAFFYGIFLVKENNTKCDKPLSKIVVEIVDIKYLLETFKTLFKKNSATTRSRFLVMIIITFLYRAAYDGETNLLYLYTQFVFHWAAVQFSYFLMVNGLVVLAGNAMGLHLFTRVLKLTDPMIMCLALVTKIVSNVIFGCSKSSEIFYIGVFASTITRMYRIANKSFFTKIVAEEDVGKTQSLICICEALGPIISVPLYNTLYVSTLASQRSTFFFFSIVLYGTSCILVLWIYYKGRLDEKAELQQQKCSDVVETVYI